MLQGEGKRRSEKVRQPGLCAWVLSTPGWGSHALGAPWWPCRGCRPRARPLPPGHRKCPACQLPCGVLHVLQIGRIMAQLGSQLKEFQPIKRKFCVI